jgi:hypothetical protein
MIPVRVERGPLLVVTIRLALALDRFDLCGAPSLAEEWLERIVEPTDHDEPCMGNRLKPVVGVAAGRH